MITQRQIRLGGMAIGLLTILNVGMLMYFFFFHQPQVAEKNDMNPQKRQANARKFVIQELGFTEEQVQKYDSLRISQRQEVRAIDRKGKALKKRFFDQLMVGVPASEVDSLANIIGSNQALIEKATYRHFESLREICNEEQKEKFDSMIREIFRLIMPPPMRHPNGKGPGPRGNGPPGPRPDGPRRPPPE